MLKTYYYVNVSVGTPPQPLTLALAFDSVGPWIYDQNTEVQCEYPLYVSDYFDYRNSSTFSIYENTSDPSFFYAHDTLELTPLDGDAPLVVLNQSWFVEEWQYEDQWCTPTSGYLGLGVPYDGKSGIAGVCQRIGENVLTVAPPLTDEPADSPFVLTLGAADSNRCSNDWAWQECLWADYSDCPFQLSAFRFGAYELDGSGALVHLSNYTYLPSDALGTVQRQLQYDPWQQGVPCDGEKPDLVFEIGGIFELHLTAAEYSLWGTDYCELLVGDAEAAGTEFLYMLSVQLFNNHCQLLSYGNSSTAFAHKLAV
ncbi:Napsin-A [Aphelenchoides fujianensis]|nr:Napsin-A [Aphelenchoides fujianensis]